MKRTTRQRLRKHSFDLRSDVFSLSNAKTYLGRLLEEASKGKSVYIARGRYRFLLQRVPEIDPIPIRPAGYFANVDTTAEIKEANQIAKASVVRAPRDLE